MSHELKNPIIPGYYPDPSICRAGDDYYLACSSFELCPGIPVFHSKDLANWEQIAYAVGPENGLHVEKNACVGGLMAPTIRYNRGTFYILNANFCDKGNYIVTAKDPAGPWSEMHYLDDIPGIDASIFFDDDDQCYVMGTGDVWDNGAGKMERGIWLAKYDIENFKLAGEPVCIFNSALRVGSSPEAPHLYHIGNYYYLMIAEGGTEHYHAVMVARSKEIFGFYEGCPANPVLTHRFLGFTAPIINVGHADFVELPDGSWYAVMLASRLIDGECKNIGRETFICPVIWEREWPVFAPGTGKVEWSYPAPECLPWTPVEPEQTFDDFDDEKLGFQWSFYGTPYEKFWRIADSNLYIRCMKRSMTEDLFGVSFAPKYRKDTFISFVARRQRQINERITAHMSFMPEGTESAGIVIMQALNHQCAVERALEDGKQVVRVKVSTSDYNVPPYMPGFKSETSIEIAGQAEYDAADIVLRFDIKGEEFHVLYGAAEDSLTELACVDGKKINPEKVGCMTGTMIGMYATGNGTDSVHEAAFDSYKVEYT